MMQRNGRVCEEWKLRIEKRKGEEWRGRDLACLWATRKEVGLVSTGRGQAGPLAVAATTQAEA